MRRISTGDSAITVQRGPIGQCFGSGRVARITLSCAVVVALAAVSAACSSGTPEGESAEYSRPQFDAPDTYTSESKLPFDAYSLPPQDMASMQTQEIDLLTECMSEKQADRESFVLVGDYVQQKDAPVLPLWGGQLGTLSERSAASYGYHAPPGEVTQPVSGYYVKTWRVRMTEILQSEETTPGSSDVASIFEACVQELPETAQTELPRLEDRESDLANRAFSDSRTGEALDRWRECMTQAGYEFNDISEASMQFTYQIKVTKAEVATALADVKCVEQSRWADVFYTVLSSYQEQAIDNDPDFFNAYRDELRQRYEDLVRAKVS
jgi:hypothetical protein